MNELIERLNEMSRVMTHSDGVVTTTVARLLTYQESYEATGLCREAADTLLALQTQLERVERETIERCAKVASDMPFQSKEERNAYRWSDTGKAMSWDIALAIRALPSTTEQQKG